MLPPPKQKLFFPSDLEEIFDMKSLENMTDEQAVFYRTRSTFPEIILEMVYDGHDQIMVAMTAQMAIQLALDTEFATQHNPLPDIPDVDQFRR